jgi:replicative DNA helicase
MAVSIASHAADVQDGTVLWISFAEIAEQTAERLVLHQSHVQPLALRTGKLQRQDMTNLTYAAATVSKWSFHIEDAIGDPRCRSPRICPAMSRETDASSSHSRRCCLPS